MTKLTLTVLFTTSGFIALVAAQGIAPSRGTDPTQIDVDINGPHLVLRTPATRDWNTTVVEINDYWEYKVHGVPKMASLCVNAAAFTVKGSLRGGRDFTGIYFEPETMHTKRIGVKVAGKPVPLHSVTAGAIKPLTKQEEIFCVGRTGP